MKNVMAKWWLPSDFQKSVLPAVAVAASFPVPAWAVDNRHQYVPGKGSHSGWHLQALPAASPVAVRQTKTPTPYLNLQHVLPATYSEWRRQRTLNPFPARFGDQKYAAHVYPSVTSLSPQHTP